MERVLETFRRKENTPSAGGNSGHESAVQGGFRIARRVREIDGFRGPYASAAFTESTVSARQPPDGP